MAHIPRNIHQDEIPRKFGNIHSDELRNIAESVAISSSVDDGTTNQNNKNNDKDNNGNNENNHNDNEHDEKKEKTPPADMSDLRMFMSQYLGNTIHKTPCTEKEMQSHQ